MTLSWFFNPVSLSFSTCEQAQSQHLGPHRAVSGSVHEQNVLQAWCRKCWGLLPPQGLWGPHSEVKGEGSQSVYLRPVSVEGPWPAGGKQDGGCWWGLGQGGGNWLKGWPGAPRNLSAMQSQAWPVFIYAEHIFISAPFSLIGQEMAGIVTYLAAQGSCWAKTHRALAALS